MDYDVEKAFNFEYWAQLWKQDPEAFEAERARMMEMLIACAPEEKRQRISAIQWRVDMVRKQAKTPMAASLRIQQMMWESLLGEHGLLNALEALKGAQKLDSEERRSASVVPFGRSRIGPQKP